MLIFQIRNMLLNTRFLVTALIVAGLMVGQPLTAQPLTLGDCREIEDTLARFNCYESLEDPGQEQPGSNSAEQSVTQDRPEVARRPGAAPEIKQQGPVNEAPDATGSQKSLPEVSVVEEAPDVEKKPLLKRLWPFGGNKDSRESEEVKPEEQATTASELESFGRSSSKGSLVENEDGKNELHDKIVSLEQLGANQWLITLESGQTWRQMISKRYLLKVGDNVRIYPTVWGSSYRLTANNLQSYIQVTRVE